MINKELIRAKIESIQCDLARLQEFSSMSFDTVAKDWKAYSVVKLLLMEIIGRAIDCNQHIISESEGVDIASPLDYRQTFLRLEEMGILPQSFAEEIAKSAGFRNAIVHGYNNLDRELVYRSIGDALSQYTTYCGYLLSYLKAMK